MNEGEDAFSVAPESSRVDQKQPFALDGSRRGLGGREREKYLHWCKAGLVAWTSAQTVRHCTYSASVFKVPASTAHP